MACGCIPKEVCLNCAEFFCLQKNFYNESKIEVYPLISRDSEKAWQEIEESYANNNSQEWLVSLEELKKLKEELHDI